MQSLRHTLPLLALATSTSLQAQFDFSQVQYWIGTGADSSVLVVDFQDGTEDASYAWGFLHDGATGADMLNAIAGADVNFAIDVAGGFLNDITYGAHAGLGGDPDYWSTWSGTSISSMSMNAGISASLSNGDWFACSYTDFDPALEPTEPIAAFDPFRFTAADVEFWVGTGQDSAVLIIDFQDAAGASSFAWGYRFDGTVTGEAMLNAIASADASMEVSLAGGFLSDILYDGFAGIGGSPNYWSTWSATNLGNWSMNSGIGTVVTNGMLFGCSYTDFTPALRPNYPVPASTVTSVIAHDRPSFQVYPQPANDVLFVTGDGLDEQSLTITNLAGQRVLERVAHAGLSTVDVSTLATGMYVLHVGAMQRTIAIH